MFAGCGWAVERNGDGSEVRVKAKAGWEKAALWMREPGIGTEGLTRTLKSTALRRGACIVRFGVGAEWAVGWSSVIKRLASTAGARSDCTVHSKNMAGNSRTLGMR
jgi:hypothetical protein